MKPTVTLAATTTPDGNPFTLREHDGDFSIFIGRDELMSSRRHESELALGRLGCERLARRPDPAARSRVAPPNGPSAG